MNGPPTIDITTVTNDVECELAMQALDPLSLLCEPTAEQSAEYERLSSLVLEYEDKIFGPTGIERIDEPSEPWEKVRKELGL